jgi:hypothetical protein
MASIQKRQLTNQKLKKNGIKPEPIVERYQTENPNRMESNQNQQLKGNKPKPETEWNQTETKS